MLEKGHVMADSKIPEKYAELARKWLEGTATPAERREYDEWFAESGDEELLIPADRGNNDDEYSEKLFAKVINRIRGQRPSRPLWVRTAIAASVSIALLSVGGLFYWKSQQGTPANTSLATTDEIYFAGNKATLELADGSRLELNQLADGSDLLQGDAVLSKESDKVIYKQSGNIAELPAYNVLRVPRGGQFRIVLADGTEVWLNSESSLRFPVAFTGAVRAVELTGEAYFEVAKSKNGNASIPFKINVNKTETVEVLGTHFNIAAYTGEKTIRTTLLEGSVRVSRHGVAESLILKPLQQSEYSDGGYKTRSGVDPDEIISWKEGIIRYKDADIQTIMGQIGRWYDVDVSYEGDIPRRTFNGGISRSSSLSQILKILEMNDINVRSVGRQLVVLP